jgi:hypothetical protein
LSSPTGEPLPAREASPLHATDRGRARQIVVASRFAVRPPRGESGGKKNLLVHAPARHCRFGAMP